VTDQQTITPDSYVVRDITIKTNLGTHAMKQTVSATVYGALAIHPRWRAEDGDGFVVTHVPTGMVVVATATYDDALEALQACVATGVPWEMKTVKKLTGGCTPEQRAAIRAIRDRHDGPYEVPA